MSTVRRTFRSVPYRDSTATWYGIVALLTRGKNTVAAAELDAIAGIAASVIADGAPREAPIIVTCDGPRTRIYCTYDEDALDEAEASEDPLGFDPLEGDWAVSLPCLTDDLEWVQCALKRSTTRITARDAATGIEVAEGSQSQAANNALTIDLEALLK